MKRKDKRTTERRKGRLERMWGWDRIIDRKKVSLGDLGGCRKGRVARKSGTECKNEKMKVKLERKAGKMPYRIRKKVIGE